MTSRRMRLLAAVAAVGAGMAVTLTASSATATGGPNTFREHLTGYEETPLALSTTGSGQTTVRIREHQITFELSYQGLEGDVTQAHIHLGTRGQTGGISVFFCTNLGNGPVGTQQCPPAPATVEGTITAQDVIGPGGQGISAGEFDELLDAIRAGATYVNVHSTLYPGGEIRGQLETGHRH